MLFVVLVGQFSHLRLRFAEPTSELGHDLPSHNEIGKEVVGIGLTYRRTLSAPAAFAYGGICFSFSCVTTIQPLGVSKSVMVIFSPTSHRGTV